MARSTATKASFVVTKPNPRTALSFPWAQFKGLAKKGEGDSSSIPQPVNAHICMNGRRHINTHTHTHTHHKLHTQRGCVTETRPQHPTTRTTASSVTKQTPTPARKRKRKVSTRIDAGIRRQGSSDTQHKQAVGKRLRNNVDCLFSLVAPAASWPRKPQPVLSSLAFATRLPCGIAAKALTRVLPLF